MRTLHKGYKAIHKRTENNYIKYYIIFVEKNYRHTEKAWSDIHSMFFSWVVKLRSTFFFIFRFFFFFGQIVADKYTTQACDTFLLRKKAF